ncbi:hypothetical protein [Bradyrhizobium tunisiense]|uniref:hypothetical protein n=1 Tax=Bradyrhizobium tunisiense TaxID=3278709 RepID=UPI0035DBA702
MSNALDALFTLLETEEEDFAALVERFGIDPAVDLQNCDLTNVDFGHLTADILNLTGSSIGGANLSNVRCRQILGAGDLLKVPHHGPSPEASVARVTSPMLDAVAMTVSKYQNADWIVDAVIRGFDDSTAPMLAFYDSSAEQDILTKRLCSVFNDLSGPLSVGPDRAKFVWFYSKAYKYRHELVASSLEKNFFDLLRTDKTSDDIGVYPYLSNRAAADRIRGSLREPYDRMRADFARSLGQEVRGGERGAVVLFSGYPPISKRLYQEIRGATNQRLKLIFLCSSRLEDDYKARSAEWRRLVVPGYAIGQPQASDKDIRRIQKRVEMASRGTVLFGTEFSRGLERHIGKPLDGLKREVMDRLTLVGSELPMAKLNIDEIVL